MDRSIVESIIEQVFPPETSVIWEPEEVDPDNKFWLIPGQNGHPSWILPNNPDFGQYILGQWHGYSRNFRWRKGVLQSLYDESKLHKVPGAIEIGIQLADDADWSHFGWDEEALPIPTIYLGAVNPKSRLIVFLVPADSDRPTLVAKVPFGPKANHCNIREAIFLGQLQLEKPGVAPELYFLDNRTGVMVEEAVFGRPSSPELNDLHIDWLLNLRVKDFTITLEQKINNLKGGLDVWSDISRDQRAFVETVLERIMDTTPIPAFWVHGDFTPSNLKQVTDTQLAAIDWEYAESRGTPLYDITRFYFSTRPINNPPTFEEMKSNPAVQRYIETLEIDEALFPKLLLYFLMDYWIRRVRDGNDTDAESYYNLMRNTMQETGVA